MYRSLVRRIPTQFLGCIKCSPFAMSLIQNYVTRKRFYKSTGILYSNGKYEIRLDHRKLKTPKGNILIVDSEPLALAVATEWDSQKNKVNPSCMHLTTLCNTVIDNPNNLTKYDVASHISQYLDTDTVLYQDEANEELYKLQQQQWDPVIEWFNRRFSSNVEKSRNITELSVNEETKAAVRKHILSHNFASAVGYMYAVDTLKSAILMLSCMERFILVPKAVHLARLEEEFQLGRWGRVEWAHDLNQEDLHSRLSAAVLFVYLNSSNTLMKQKGLTR